MELKELVRNIVHGELEDISVYEVEADAFGGDPEQGAALRKLFLELAEEKRERLPLLQQITKQSVGYRQRRTEPARSIEAALRAHAVRAERAAGLYALYARQLLKPERKQVMLEFSAAEYRGLRALRDFLTLLKKSPK